LRTSDRGHVPTGRAGAARGGYGDGREGDLIWASMANERALAEADREIAACKRHIERQQKLIAEMEQLGLSTEVALDTLQTCETTLRNFENHRQLILKQLRREEERRPGRHGGPCPSTPGIAVPRARPSAGGVFPKPKAASIPSSRFACLPEE